MTNCKEIASILEAIEMYAEAGRKGSRKIGEDAFTQEATMSWMENGEINTVPISTLFDILEQTGEEDVAYNIVSVDIAGNIASVRIKSTFSKLGTFDDMFTLAVQNDKWRIVSKIYHAKYVF